MPQRPDRFPSCDVCERTILKGEQVHEYVTAQGQRLRVCHLCRSRAEASGWIPAEQYGAVVHAPAVRARRGLALRRRLERAASRARATARSSQSATPRQEQEPEPAKAAPRHPAEPEPKPKVTPPRQQPPSRRARPQGKRSPKPRTAKQPGQRKTPRRRRGPEAIMRGAVERFNSSEERRKVAGLIRSLGEPHAAVRPDPGRQLALVTVAWELSWYQWEVGGDDETVREVAKGNEVSELAEDARTWNAAVGENGTLRLRAAGGPSKASAKQA